MTEVFRLRWHGIRADEPGVENSGTESPISSRRDNARHQRAQPWHQALPGRITPQQAWEVTPKVEAPRPVAHSVVPLADSDELRMTRTRDNGAARARGTKFEVSRNLTGTIAYRIEDDDSLQIFDSQGTLMIQYPWPEPGTKFVGSGLPRGPEDQAQPGECRRCPDT